MKTPTVTFWLTETLGISGGWAGQFVAVPEVVMQTSPSPGEPWTTGTDVTMKRALAMTKIALSESTLFEG
jgi:hypothetical protein